MFCSCYVASRPRVSFDVYSYVTNTGRLIRIPERGRSHCFFDLSYSPDIRHTTYVRHSALDFLISPCFPTYTTGTQIRPQIPRRKGNRKNAERTPVIHIISISYQFSPKKGFNAPCGQPVSQVCPVPARYGLSSAHPPPPHSPLQRRAPAPQH